MRRLIVSAGLVLAFAGSGAGGGSDAQGFGQATAQSSPSFTWVTPDLPWFSWGLELGGTSDASLLASLAGDADFNAARPVLWDATTTSSTPLPTTAEFGGQAAVIGDGHAFFSIRRTSGGQACDLFVSSRDGASITSVFDAGLDPISLEGVCTIFLAGDGNRVLVPAQARDPNPPSDSGWFVVDGNANAQKLADFSTNPFGRPYMPFLSPNNVDAVVPQGQSTASPDLAIVHLDGRPPTSVVLPPGYFLPPWPLEAGFGGIPWDPGIRDAMEHWAPDGSKLVIPLLSTATGTTRISVLSMDGSVSLLGPPEDALVDAFGESAGVSRDGTHVAYLTQGSTGLSLWVSKLDGSEDRRVSVDLSDVAQIDRSGSAFAVLTHNSAAEGDRLYWVSGDGSSVVPLSSSGSGFEIFSLEWATADAVFVAGRDSLGPSGESGNAIYAIDVSGAGTPLRLIPYPEGGAGFVVTGVSENGSRVSGWAQVSLSQPSGLVTVGYRGWTVTLKDEPPPPPDTFKYVALGDSYASGEGVDPYFRDGYDSLSGTQPGNVDNRCHRSTRAYAEWVRRPADTNPLYATASGGGKPGTGKRVNKYGSDQNVRSAGNVAWVFWACSGARTINVLPEAEGGQRQNDGKYRERYTQLDNPSVDSATDLVTLIIGGNDAGFADAVFLCFVTACNTPSFQSNLEAAIDGLRFSLPRVYEAIKSKAPKARVLVLGYPQIFPPLEKQSCGKLRPWRGEMDLLRTMGLRLNKVIRESAENSGLTYLDPTAVFAGHEVCGVAGEWINGPSATYKKSKSFTDDQSFHPKQDGQRAYAEIVNAALG